jgi:amino acid permease
LKGKLKIKLLIWGLSPIKAFRTILATYIHFRTVFESKKKVDDENRFRTCFVFFISVCLDRSVMMMMLLFWRWLRDGLFPATVTVTMTVLAFPVMNVCVFCLDRINAIQK